MKLDDLINEPFDITVQVFNQETPFGGVQILHADDRPVQIEINTGSPVTSVFGRVGDIQPLCTDYDQCYANVSIIGIPDGGNLGEVLSKRSAASYDVQWSSAGSGSVTNFSAGSLSPVFTSTVANPSTTPALSFLLSNAGSHMFLGNETGSAAPPHYVQPNFTDLAGTIDPGQIPSTVVVTSFNTRTGAVVSLVGDYSAFYAPLSHTQAWSTITGTPTTLVGYGISDAQPLDADLTSIAALATTAYGRGFLPLVDAAAARTYIGAGTGIGTVTNIATTSPITGGPITGTGTLALNVAVDHAFTALQSITVADAATNTITPVLTLSHNTSGAAAQAYGTGIQFKGKTDTTADRLMGQLSVIWNIAADATRQGVLRWQGANQSGLTANGTYIFYNNCISTNDFTDHGGGVIQAGGGFRAAAVTNPTAGFFLQASGNVYTNSAYGFPTSIGAGGQILRSNGTNAFTLSTAAYPATAGTSGNVLTSDGTNWNSSPPAGGGAVSSVSGTAPITVSPTTGATIVSTSMATDSILGRATAGTGVAEVLGALPFAFTGDVTRPIDSNAQTIALNAVTYAKMQDVTATSRFLGRITAGAGDLEELTGTQATTLLDLATSALKGLVPASGGGTTNFLRADMTWQVPAGGGNVSNSGTPTANQLPIWVSATTIKGVTGLTGGTTGQQLTKNSATDYDWAWAAAGGSGSPGGANTNIQYNNSGAFGGAPNAYIDAADGMLTCTGTGIAGFWSQIKIVPTAGGDAAMFLRSSHGTPNDWFFGAGSGAGWNHFRIVDLTASVTDVLTIRTGAGHEAVLAGKLGWTSTDAGGTLDTAIGRSAAGVVEINNATTGTFRDLKLRTLLLNPGAAPTGVEGALYGNSTDHKVYYHNGTTFVDLTAGGAGGSPGGSTTQVQFNDAGAFGGDAGLTYDKTTKALAFKNVSGDTGQFLTYAVGTGFGLDGHSTLSANNSLILYSDNASQYDGVNNIQFRFGYDSTMERLRATRFGLYLASTSELGWSSTGTSSGTVDIGFARNAAGKVEINNGTAGTYRDLILRNITTPAADATGLFIGGGTGAIITANSTGTMRFSQSGDGMLLYPSGGYLMINSGLQLVWDSTGDCGNLTKDVGLQRSAAGTLKVTNGSSGTGIITGNGTVPAGGATGQQLTKNSNTDYDVGWAAAGSGGGAVSDGVYPTGWDTDTTTAPSRNAVRDYLHLIDTDDDGKVNVLDTVAGLVKTDASGIVSNATAKTDYWDTTDFVAGASAAHGLVPTPGTGGGITKFLREDATWVVPPSGGGTPGGSVGQMQWNDASAFNGTSGATATATQVTLVSPIINNTTTYTGTPLITTASTSMALENTGDSNGTVRLKLLNRFGINGALFENAGLDLVDFGFKPLTGPQAILRLEHRAGALVDSTGNTSGEFQLNFDSSSAANIGWVFGTNTSALGGELHFGTLAGASAVPANRDVGLIRNANGVLEINNGTPGTFRDLRARTVLGTGSSTPSFSFSGDTSTGVASTAAGWVDIYANGVAGMGITGTGFVIPAGATMWFGNSTAIHTSVDAALTRSAAGVVKVTDGTTGTGSIISKPRINSSTSASATTWSPNADTTDIFTLAGILSANVSTISNPSGTPVDGQKLMFRIKAETTPHTLAWTGTQYRASSDGPALPIAAASNKTFYAGFIYNATDTKWDLLAYLNNV